MKKTRRHFPHAEGRNHGANEQYLCRAKNNAPRRSDVRRYCQAGKDDYKEA